MNADHLPVRTGIGHRRVGFAANQARARRGSANDNPRNPGDLAWEDLVCQLWAWRELARGHKQANPGAQLAVIHTS